MVRDVKWELAKRVITVLESQPEIYGPSLLELDPQSQLNNLTIHLLPDDLDNKIDFYKAEYWEVASRFDSRFSTIVFALLCSYGKIITNKILVNSYMSLPVTQLTPSLTLNSLNIDDDYIEKFNRAVGIYTDSTMLNYINSATSKAVNSVMKHFGYSELKLLWSIRVKYIVR